MNQGQAAVATASLSAAWWKHIFIFVVVSALWACAVEFLHGKKRTRLQLLAASFVNVCVSLAISIGGIEMGFNPVLCMVVGSVVGSMGLKGYELLVAQIEQRLGGPKC